MNKNTKAILIRNFDAYSEKPINSGLGQIYKDWSDEKQRAYDSIKRKLSLEFNQFDLRCTYGNTFCFNCAAVVRDNEGNYFFIVFTPYQQYVCWYSPNALIDENGVIFYEF